MSKKVKQAIITGILLLVIVILLGNSLYRKGR